MAPGRCGGCERSKGPPCHPGRGGSGPGLCGSCGRGLGAGLTYGCRRSPERVWTLLALPLESLPTALTVKGAGGGGTAGKDSFLTDHVVDCLQTVDIKETLR